MTDSNFKLMLICSVINAPGGQHATKLMISSMAYWSRFLHFYVQSRICCFM